MTELDYLPSVIVLGGSSYKVIQRDAVWREAKEVDGQCRFEDMEVDVVVEGRPASEISNTFIHECLHLCYREFNVKPKCGEERTVTALGFAINALFAQNPDLVYALASLQEAARDQRSSEA